MRLFCIAGIDSEQNNNTMPISPLKRRKPRLATALNVGCFCVPLVTALVLSGKSEPYAVPVAVVLAVLILLFMGLTVMEIGGAGAMLLVLIFLFAAFVRSSYTYAVQYRYGGRLLAALNGTEHSFTAVVNEQDVRASGGMYLLLSAVDGQALLHRVPVYGYNRSGLFLTEGTTVSFTAQLRMPKTEAADGSRSEVAWMRGKGVAAVADKIAALRVETDSKSKRSALRAQVFEGTENVLSEIPDKDVFMRTRALARALMFGDRSGFSKQETERFSRSGMTHLLCVSGMHFAVILNGLGFLMRQFCPRRRVRRAFLLAVSGMYLFVCGFAVSAVRAAVMALAASADNTGGDREKGLRSLLMAAALLCLIRSETVFDAGFHLSVLSCAGILCAQSALKPLNTRLQKHPVLYAAVSLLQPGVGAFAFTFLYAAAAFGETSLVSPLASAVAGLPTQACLALSWFTAFAGRLHFGALSFALASITSRLSEFVFRTAVFFASFPGAVLTTELPDISLALFLAGLFSVMLAASKQIRGARIYGYAFAATVFSAALCLFFC